MPETPESRDVNSFISGLTMEVRGCADGDSVALLKSNVKTLAVCIKKMNSICCYPHCHSNENNICVNVPKNINR